MSNLTNKYNKIYHLTPEQRVNREKLKEMSDLVRSNPDIFTLAQIIEPLYIKYALVSDKRVLDTVTIINEPNNFNWIWTE